MPPRLSLRGVSPLSTLSTQTTTIASFLVPFLHTQARCASILSSLSDLPGAYNKRIRRGRGPSSGKGKTSGRGHKGQKQHGKVPKGFQGGQTSEGVVHGKFGFKNIHSIELSPINLDRIQDWINQGRLNPKYPITLKQLASSRAIHGVKDGVKLLARNSTALTTPINIIVSRASEAAIAAVEAVGGTVTTRFYTKQAIKRIRAGEMHPYISLRWDPQAIGNPALETATGYGNTIESRVKHPFHRYRLPDPTSRKEIEYYRDVKNRGYLAHTVKEGESASLFYKPPLSEEEIAILRKGKGRSNPEKKQIVVNKMW